MGIISQLHGSTKLGVFNLTSDVCPGSSIAMRHLQLEVEMLRFGRVSLDRLRSMTRVPSRPAVKQSQQVQSVSDDVDWFSLRSVRLVDEGTVLCALDRQFRVHSCICSGRSSPTDGLAIRRAARVVASAGLLSRRLDEAPRRGRILRRLVKAFIGCQRHVRRLPSDSWAVRATDCKLRIQIDREITALHRKWTR